MIQPVNYYQTDTRWAKKKYGPKNNSTMTIGSSGCGPTCAAMVIQSLKNNGVTPADTCTWSMNHGQIANVGTYWTYFEKQFDVYNIDCTKTTSADKALKALKNGDWVISIMGKGNWTNGGHFILVYGYEDGYVHINDPYSTLERRIYSTWKLLKAENSGSYWIIKVPEDVKQNGIKCQRVKSKQLWYVSSTSGLKVRTGASTLHKAIRKIAFNDEVQVLATKGNWAMIGKGEWVNTKYLSKQKSINKSYKALQKMNVRNGYSVKGTKILKTINKGKTFKVTKIRNNWGYSPALKGWVCLKGDTVTYCEEV